ncbi:hypothetical protein GH769_00285 [Pseudomonas sp. CFSAN084952]|uniref:S-type pyocin domain-containing protein n=1 Tax=Pseudomonas TaxID=286 RepID=UPI0012996B6A|nr:S-type pyocin domain-containing protein [Pseudomonas sp. CFSAN084952]QGF91729.1 hypothetical protein GH769_00285 [Pseudomonas sp. CFSAN084952]
MSNGDTICLPEIEINFINKYEPQKFAGDGGDSGFSHSYTGQLINVATHTYVLNTCPAIILQSVKDLEASFSMKLPMMPESVANSISATEQNEGSPESEVAKIEQHILSVEPLIAKKTQASAAQKMIADKYCYGDLFRFSPMQFIKDVISVSKTNYPQDKNYKEWYALLESASAAKYSSREIDYFNILKQNLQAQTNQACENVEAKCIADEAGRVAAQVEAKRLADEQARIDAERATQQEAQEVLLQLGTQLTAITAPMQQQVTQLAKQVDTAISVVAEQISNTLNSVYQSTQQTFNEVEAQVTQLVSAATGQINAGELDMIIKDAQAQRESSVPRFIHNTNRLITEATAFAGTQKSSLNQSIENETKQMSVRLSELGAQVQATPTRAAAQNAQQLLQQTTDAASANVNAQAYQAEAAVRSKAEETTAALRLAQETAQASLQGIPHSVQAGLARVANTYCFNASVTTALTIPGQGVVPLGEAASALCQAIKGVVALMGEVDFAAASAASTVGLFTLAYSSSMAGPEQDERPARFRYALGVSPDLLELPSGTYLASAAAVQGSVDLPFRLINETLSDGRSYVSLVKVDEVNVPSSVSVRGATLDLQTGLYSLTVPSLVVDQPGITLTWTPANLPGEHSLTATTLAVTPTVPTYTGVELKPLVIEAETYPGVVTDVSDLIISFPANSGLEPIYLMFSEPLDSGIFTRRQLDKKYTHPKAQSH